MCSNKACNATVFQPWSISKHTWADKAHNSDGNEYKETWWFTDIISCVLCAIWSRRTKHSHQDFKLLLVYCIATMMMALIFSKIIL